MKGVQAVLWDWVEEGRWFLRLEPTRWAEFLMGVLTLSWPLAMFLPDWYKSSNSLGNAMRELAPVWLWGTCLLIVGGVQIIAAVGDYLRLRRLATLGCVWYWMFLSWIFWHVEFALPGRFSCPMAALLSVHIYCRLGVILRKRTGGGGRILARTNSGNGGNGWRNTRKGDGLSTLTTQDGN